MRVPCLRRAVAEAKTAWRAGHRRAYRPWVPEPEMWLQFDWGAGPVIAVWHMITNDVDYTDLGPAYFLTRTDPDRQARRLIGQLHQLGHHVDLHPVFVQADPRCPQAALGKAWTDHDRCCTDAKGAASENWRRPLTPCGAEGI